MNITNKEMSKEKCQYLIWNILELLNAKNDIPATIITSEIFELNRCEGFTQTTNGMNKLNEIKNNFESHIGLESCNRIKNCDTEPKDEEKALRAVFHYSAYSKSCLVSNLNWPNYMYYYGFYQAEKTIASLGIFGLGASFGAKRFLPIIRGSVQHIKDLKNKKFDK